MTRNSEAEILLAKPLRARFVFGESFLCVSPFSYYNHCSVFFRYITNLQYLANSFLKKYLLFLLSKKIEMLLQHFQELMVRTLKNSKKSCQQKQFFLPFFFFFKSLDVLKASIVSLIIIFLLPIPLALRSLQDE